MTEQLRDQLQATLSGSYTLERELGGGGMSRVFVAEETALGRKVVIKVLPPEMGAQVSLERFKREIVLAAKLQHPHIVPVHLAGESNGVPYFTMPFVEGESLRVRLARHGELPVNEAIRVLREIASALAYAHERGIVHRDIKPDNVLLSGGSAMVTDFGVAKALSASGNGDTGMVTSLGVALGTPAYMSPEQASADPTVDHRADIYSFGVLGYELLTGQPPFVGRTPQNLLAAHVTEVPESIGKRRASLPPALAALVMRCLEKRPADRPQSAAEIVHALDDITTPSGGIQPTNAVDAYATAGPRVTGRPSRATLVGGVSVAAVVVALLGYAASHRSGAGSDARTIAVLPFASADTATEYRAVGISDAVRSALTSDMHGVRIMSRNSSLGFRGKSVDARQAGQKLGVSTVLSGDVSATGTSLHITAELINVADGSAIWSRTYDRDAKDIFALQDSIVHGISSALQAPLADAGGRATGQTNVGTSNLQAYDLFLRARFQENKRNAASLRAASELYRQAIALDPGFARAHAGLGTSISALPSYSNASRDSSAAPAMAEIDRAIALDSMLSEAYAARGVLLFNLYRWADAERSLRRAIALDPQYGTAHRWLADCVYRLGRLESADSAYRRATELDPLQAVAWNNYGTGLWALGRDSAALAAWNRALELDPGFYPSAKKRATVFARRGATALALQEIERRRSGFSAEDLSARAYVFARVGQRADAERIVRDLERNGKIEGPFANALGYAHLGLGDVDRALDLFIRAARTHDGPIALTPDFEPIRSHPRYAELMRVMDLQGQPIAKWTGSNR